MAGGVTYFLAPDDEIAATTRDHQPDRAFTSVTFHNFDPDDAVVEWARYFDAPDQPFSAHERLTQGTWPRYVADFRNDGVGVFVMLATRWSEYLMTVEDELSSDELVTVVRDVARLAVVATESVGRLRLYCRQC